MFSSTCSTSAEEILESLAELTGEEDHHWQGAPDELAEALAEDLDWLDDEHPSVESSLEAAGAVENFTLGPITMLAGPLPSIRHQMP